ncbi:MAG: efflux RND transporter permease subunit [Verrucomicrobia bacterium]|nr:efflux RND transporter permease subunit [Verrucomicrobiota bacterium]NBU08233.1 efflux RND transporter permease subunit [Pseudomonadota bacterium]NDA65805.1 efflux RND transporter permease subunit [Verrucomicrobiota bacterium]NDB74525.1 efflux RND transporter permease subunit [Verrucomicrobiota bacterium]NDD37672.1 efflux RND transporter permease subunit [Verrucomicrobiota bacterium]
MLNAIVSFSLRHRGIVVALACLLLFYGLYVAKHAKLDVFPDFMPPQVTVQAEAPGMTPEQVESLVTRPIETAVNGLGYLESLRSESIQGLSVVTVVFKEGTDIHIARQTLAEKLSTLAAQLPAGVAAPKMSPLVSATMDLLKIGLVSEKLSSMELRTFADWTLKPRLLSVPGVTRCIVFGGEVRQLQVQVRPDRLVAHDLALSEVLSTARLATGVRGAGFVETQNQRILIQTEGQSLTPAVLGEVVIVHKDGVPVRLCDVANVVEGAEPKFGDCVIQGKPGVLLALASQFGANTLDATHALEEALEELEPVFKREGITVFPRLHRPATFIEESLKSIKASLLLGGVLVAVVLFIFLGHFRTALISVTAIPLSLLAAIIVLDRLGVTLNTITLGGLAIAIGEVVDDAIIDVENIFRRLRENQLAAAPRPLFAVILDASLEVRTAVVFATFVVALVFVPVLTLTGLQGKFFAPLALAYIIAILASLGVALTLTPALAFLLFGRGVRETKEPRLQTWLKRIYLALLGRIAKSPNLVIAAVVLVCAGAAFKLPGMGKEFLPEFREGHLVLQVSAAPGTSLAEMLRIGKQISEELMKDEHIATVEQQAGRAEAGEDTWSPHRSEFHVELKPGTPGEEQEHLMKEIRELLGKYPGLQFEVLTFLGDRISESISGETAQVVVNVFGDDLEALDAKAGEVAKVLEKVPGAKDVQLKAPPGGPRRVVKLRPDRLTQYGFRPVEVLEAVQTAFQGTIVAQTFRGSQVSDVAVILASDARREPEAIGDLLLRNAQGLRLPLRELADVYPATGRALISHEGARRRQTVTCNTQGRDVASFVEDAKHQIAEKVKFPRGVYPEYGGAAEAQAAAQRQILLHSGLAAVGILLLLSVVFKTARNLLLVLANVPFAMVGGALFVVLAGLFDADAGALNIGSLVGFVTLFGITMRNSIMMISHYEHLVAAEGMTWGLDCALRGASERLVPILMTALVTGLGLLPLAMHSGEAGAEIEGPMAVVILGGLITSTVLNLLVLPTLAVKFGRFTENATKAA